MFATSPFEAIRSAPTTTHPIRPECKKCPAILSVISVAGIPSCCSSHAVNRAPCRNGRVSSAKTSICFPASLPRESRPVQSRSQPSPTRRRCNASAPSCHPAPAPRHVLPMASQIAISSSRICFASATMRSATFTVRCLRDCSLRIRSIAQNKIHRGRPRRRQGLAHASRSPRPRCDAQRDSHRRRHANRRSSANHHVANRLGHFQIIAARHEHLLSAATRV